MGLDGDPAFPLKVHGIENLLAGLSFCDGSREVEEAIRECGLPVVDMGDDAEVAYAFNRIVQEAHSFRHGVNDPGGNRGTEGNSEALWLEPGLGLDQAGFSPDQNGCQDPERMRSRRIPGGQGSRRKGQERHNARIILPELRDWFKEDDDLEMAGKGLPGKLPGAENGNWGSPGGESRRRVSSSRPPLMPTGGLFQESLCFMGQLLIPRRA